MGRIETKLSVTEVTIKGEENISLLFTAMCYAIAEVEKMDVDLERAERVMALCEEVRSEINQKKR